MSVRRASLGASVVPHHLVVHTARVLHKGRIAISSCPHGILRRIIKTEGRGWGSRVGRRGSVLHQGCQALALRTIRHRLRVTRAKRRRVPLAQRKVDHGGENIHELHQSLGSSWAEVPAGWIAEEQRGTGGALKVCLFAELAQVAELPAVVAEEDNHGGVVEPVSQPRWFP